MSKKSKKKIINIRLTDIVIVSAIIALICFLIIEIKSKNIKNEIVQITPEIARSKEYDTVNAGEENTNSEYIKFDAFFLKDLDGDGNADPIRGTCNEVGKEDTLYMDLKVLNNGYFKDGKITINSSNFYFNTAIVKDNVISSNYISNNTKTIKLKQMPNGSQKLITGMVRSGDYSNTYNKTEAIGNDTNKYSKINSITITGTHVDDDNHETKINKTINFVVDWYGTTKAGIAITNVKNEVDSFEQLLDGNNMVLEFTIKTEEKDNKLILKSSNLEGTIPELNGYKPISVEVLGDDITYTYDNETGNFTVKKDAVINGEGIVTDVVNTGKISENRYNTYRFKVVYPREAYDNMDGNDIQLLIPARTYYEGYNNPNNEFSNPYVSNIAEATIVTRWIKYEGFAYRFDIYVGKYVTSPYTRYVISKEKPLRIYNNISDEEKEDYYKVRWVLTTGSQGTASGAIMKETKTGETQVSDKFIKKDSTTESMENLTTNVGIYFVGADSMLGENGWIKVYNDSTDELIETFTKENWNTYNESNPYYYNESIKHIRVETSTTNKNTSFNVYNIKELDDKYITEHYTKENFDKLQYIGSTLNGTYGTSTSKEEHSAYYEAPFSIADINISKSAISTQETTKNQIITITTEASKYNEQKWKNGIFLVKIPKEIIDMEINSITVDNNNVSILGYDLYEEDDIYYIKILTENENEETYSINIDCNMTPDPRNSTVARNVELYAINEQGIYYYHKDTDKYDIDGDSNTSEISNYVKTKIDIISPNDLLTNQIAKNYDETTNITIAPRIAKVEKEQRTADIDVNLTNNYAQKITNVVLQGVIPFQGNKFVIGNRDLGSTFSTNMTNAGITVPNELREYATVYYSTKEQPTNDLNDTNNMWQTKDQVVDWSQIKTYAIDLGTYELQNGESHTFKYTINIPEGVNYNQVSYSEHAIYFDLMTDSGKYSTYTASDKLGFMIAKQYDLEIEKFQQNTTKKLSGITFKVTEEGENDSKIKVTNSNGKITVYGLYAERTYILKEIKTTSDYLLNDEEIKIYTYTDDEDKLYVTYKNDNGTYSDLTTKYSWLKSATAVKNDGEEYKVKVQLENEPKVKLKITKKSGGNNLQGVRFKLTGRGKNDVIFSTNSRGEITTSGLYLNEQYTLQETKATGYYLPNNAVRFKLKNDMSLEITGDGITSSNVTTTDEIPTINLQLENEKIPEYSLKITKKEKDTETPLKGTQFKLTGEDKNENTIYTTDENGVIQINNLYEYVNGKNITAKYTLREFYPTEGYILNETPLVFKAERNASNELEFKVESGSIRGEAEVDNTNPNKPIIKITIDNEPIFTLTKVDEETNEPLEGVEFKITDMNDHTATDVNGNSLNSVTTDSNGKARLSLGEGLYKAIETKPLPGYEQPEQYTGIGIGEGKEAETNVEFDRLNDELDYSSYKDITTVEDGVIAVAKNGKVVKYDFNGDIIWKNTEKSYIYNGVTTVEGGVIAVGSSGRVVKYSFNGNIIWENAEKSYAYNGVTTVENGVITVGNSGKVVKYDLNGNIIWENTEKTYTYNGVTIVEDGVIAVAEGGQVVKYDLNGNIIWENTEKTDKYSNATAVEDGIIVSVTNSTIMMKYDFEGNFLWREILGSNIWRDIVNVDGDIVMVSSRRKCHQK